MLKLIGLYYIRWIDSACQLGATHKGGQPLDLVVSRELSFIIVGVPSVCDSSLSLIKKIIIKSLNKSCDLDPLPTWLLKKCVDQSLSLITAIINR